METFKSVLIEDLEVYKKSLDLEEYNFCNIISNRLITNAVLLDSKEYNLIGAILKEALNFIAIVEEPKNIQKELKNLTEKFIKLKEININIILQSYLEFFNSINDDINPQYEKYKENLEYSVFSTKYYLNFLKEELSDQNLPYNRDLIYFGVSNELNRVFRNFGCTIHQLILKILIIFTARVYEYYRFLILSCEPKNSFWEAKYINLKEKIKNNVENFNIDDEYLVKTTELLFEICTEWRQMFIRLIEVSQQVQREKTSIPPKIKEELKEMVSKVTSSEKKGE